MAGGMSRRGGGVPLSARVRAGGHPQGSGGPPAPFPGPQDGECPARHCWVGEAADQGGVKRPGLLLEWRRGGEGWEGRVVYAAALRPGRWALVEEWLPGSALTPR